MTVLDKIESKDLVYINIISTDVHLTVGGEYFESTDSMENCEINRYFTTNNKLESLYNCLVFYINWETNNNK